MAKKRFYYEYDETTEIIMKSLIGKSYMQNKDFQSMADVLIKKAYFGPDVIKSPYG